MNHRATKVVSQAFLCLLAMSMWTAVATPKAHAAQLSGTDKAVPNRHQEPQPPELQDSGTSWSSGWSYGGRGILSRLGQENLDSGLGFTVFSVRRLIADLELETETGRLIMSAKPDSHLPLGHLSMFPLRATLRVQLWRFGGAKPYAGGGIGVYLNRFNVDESIAAELATTGFATAVNVNPALGFHGAGGVEWQFGPANFNVDVKYVVAKANVVATLVDQLNEKASRELSSLDLGGFWLAAGIRFNF